MRPFVVLAVLCLFACSTDRSMSEQELYRWMQDETNGLISSKVIDDVKITVKYLPPQVQALRELDDPKTQDRLDSVTKGYINSRSFIMTFSSELEGKDIMYKGVEGKQDFKERVGDLSFNINHLVKVNAGGKEFAPALYHFEQNYGTSKNRNVLLVFADQEHDSTLLKADKLDLVFIDEIFNTGISHFGFDRTDLENIPNLKLN